MEQYTDFQITLPADGQESDARMLKAINTLTDYGQCEGGHHKMWVINQALKDLLGEKQYKEFVDWYTKDEEYEWDEGIAP